MKAPVFINHLDYYVPEERFVFADHLDYFDNGHSGPPFETKEKFLEFIKKYINIESVCIEPNLSHEEMTLSIIKKAIENKKLDPTKVLYILVGADLNHQLENFGHRVQYELDIKKANVVRLVENFCANVDVAIGMAKRILEAETQPAQILIISGSKLGNGFDRRIVGSYGVLGDASAIIVMSNSDDGALLEVIGQEGVTRGVLYNVDLAKDNTILHFQAYTESFKLLMNRLKMTAADISAVILHNANLLLVTEALKSCGVKAALIDKTNLYKYGHLGSADLVLNLKTYLENNPGKHENILSTNLGVIGSYYSTLFKR